MAFKSSIDREQFIIQNAWLGLEDRDFDDVSNILGGRTEYDLDNPQEHLVRLLRRPENFYLTCKYLLNVELLPLQVVVLQELWKRSFPILIGVRGFSKSFLLAVYSTLKCLLVPNTKIVICGAAFRQSKVIFEYMETIWENSPILRDICSKNSGGSRDIDRVTMFINDSWAIGLPIGDGCTLGETNIAYLNELNRIDKYHSEEKITQTQNKVWTPTGFKLTDEAYRNGVKKVYELTTSKGYKIKVTDNHPFKTLINNNFEWKQVKDLKIGNSLLIDRSERWHEGQSKLTIDEGYTIGALIGDGSYINSGLIRFTSKDPQIVERCENGLGKKFTKLKDNIHYDIYGEKFYIETLTRLGLEPKYTIDKKIPQLILNAPKHIMTACLQGLFDTDGTLQVCESEGTALSVSFCGISKELVYQIQYLLLYYGIIGRVSYRDRKDNRLWKGQEIKNQRVYELLMTGLDAEKFIKKIGFYLSRKQEKALNAILSKKKHITYDKIPGSLELVRPLLERHPNHVWNKFLKKAKSLTFIRANEILQYFEDIEDPILEKLKQLANPNFYYDEVKSIEYIGEHEVFDIHVPDGHEYTANGFIVHNSKIRGLRAHSIIADEVNSINREVFETVIQGFTAVSASPVQNVKEVARMKKLKEKGRWDEEQQQNYMENKRSNQTILSGTAGYDFQNFASYWKQYRKIIESKGDLRKLEEVYPDGIPDSFNPEDYSIIRIPYELTPDGFMDEKAIARAKATINTTVYLTEYGACFSKDSNGFFPRSLIEKIVAKEDKPVKTPSGNYVWFDPSTRGNRALQYVMGIDPASEQDNFTINVLELHDDHRRLVYCWSTNRDSFKKRQKEGLTMEYEYYGFCVKKIRELMRYFNIVEIGLDSQGGGRAIEEGLHDPDKMEKDENPIWPVIDPEKEQDTDDQPGLHILRIINFADSKWTSEANHGLKKDMEDCALIFPRFDSLTISLATEEDERMIRAGNLARKYDSLEDCILEIEDLKDELSTIVMSQTEATARERWSTPEVKLEGGKKGKLRKDRYTALLISNMVARGMQRHIADIVYDVSIGGLAKGGKKIKSNKLFIAPEWFNAGLNTCTVVKRRR